MSDARDLSQLSQLEKEIELYWSEIVKFLLDSRKKSELSNIFKPEVKNRIAIIDNKFKKIEAILMELHRFHKDKGQEFEKLINEIERLHYLLKRIEPDSQWIESIHIGMQNIIFKLDAIK